MSTKTREALAGLGTSVTAAPDKPTTAQAVVDTVTGWLSRRTSRRGFLARSAVVGTALAVDPVGYVLRPGTAYAAVCGPGASCSSGWTVFCATINKGVNACPPGSIAAGWWKMDGASLCGGKARYIIDCNATCSRCSSPSSRAGICAPSCWSCTCTCGPSGSCDQRKVCCNGFRYGQCNTQVRQVGAVQCRVVSCTPPWRFEKCSTSPATDNRTRDHNSSELPQVYNAITARYIALGENGSVLGATVYGQGSIAGGKAQRYQNGRISSGPKGTWETHGPIHARYAALGFEAGGLGFPLGKQAGVYGGGIAQDFVGGRVVHHVNAGTWEVYGGMERRYRALGLERGVMGYPLGATTNVPGGRGQAFQGGRISQGPKGAWETRGPMAARYTLIGAEAGPLGFPVGAQAGVWGGGIAQDFTGGRMTYHVNAGAFETLGALEKRYRALGLERGSMGYPLTGTGLVVNGAGLAAGFQGGRLSARNGAPAWEVTGAILLQWQAHGLEAGRLGFPTGPPTAGEAGTTTQAFEGGTLTYDPATGEVSQS